MSKTVKRFRKYNEDYDEYHSNTHDHRQHLNEKRLRAALSSKVKSNLLDIIEDESF
jgi:hypothetical protein